MFVDLRLYLRSRDALVELFRVAERRQADVVTAQVCFFLVEVYVSVCFKYDKFVCLTGV